LKNIKIKLPKKMVTAIHLADLQVPFHDRKLWKLAKKFIKKYPPDYIINHGDWAECHHWSRYEDRGNNLQQPHYLRDKPWNADIEIEEVQKTWKEIKQYAPNAIMLYTGGNHEDRVLRDAIKNKRESIIKKDNFVDVFNVYDYWDEYVDWGYGIQLGNLWCTHGTTTSIYAARKMLQIWGKSVVFGHCHRQQFWLENPCGANIKAAWGLPCMCRLDPHYTSQPNWNHGIGYSKHFPSGKFNLQVLPTINYSLVFGTEIINGKS